MVFEGRVGSVRYRWLNPAEIEFRFFPRNLILLRTIPIFPTGILLAFVWLVATGLRKGDQGAFWIGFSFILVCAPLVLYMHRLAWIPRTIRVTRRTIFSSRPGLLGMLRDESPHNGEIGALLLENGVRTALILTSPSGEHLAWLITTKQREQIEELLRMLKQVVRVEEGSISRHDLR